MGREAIVKIKRGEGFTVLPNSLLRDDRLSLKTKGLFCMMLSFPGDWAYSVGGLVSVCGAGRDAIRAAMRELEAAGYLDRERTHNEDGRFVGMVYTLHMVSTIPQTENPSMVGETCAPQTGFPAPENPTLQNKDYINTPYSPPQEDAQAPAQKCAKRAPDWELFERFWQMYPKKKDKERARKVWKQLNPDLELCRIMSVALKKDMYSWDWRKQGGAYIPYPATWLRNRRWEDEHKPPESGPDAFSGSGWAPDPEVM